ncbi:MAG: hypothetical protein KY476_09390 [Planctomycetes bacterium]|nr:hypothetical protein [Planctomycetota bacterium]
MAPVDTNPQSLRRLFAALTETTFQVELGVADPPIIDYLADLLVRFVRLEAIFKIRDTSGRRLEEVAEMMLEAQERQANPQREIYRHIGDFTLFWSGVYPEALRRLRSADRKDHLLDYCREGKRSYYLASTFDDEPYREESRVLRRLSEEFELCSFGLNRVRREWEKLPHQVTAAPWDAEQN